MTINGNANWNINWKSSTGPLLEDYQLNINWKTYNKTPTGGWTTKLSTGEPSFRDLYKPSNWGSSIGYLLEVQQLDQPLEDHSHDITGGPSTRGSSSGSSSTKKTGHLIKGLIIKLPPMDHQLSKFYWRTNNRTLTWWTTTRKSHWGSTNQLSTIVWAI